MSLFLLTSSTLFCKFKLLVSVCLFSRYFSTETNLKAVLNQLIAALMSHLASRSDEHRRLAKDCIEETIKQIGTSFSSAVNRAGELLKH